MTTTKLWTVEEVAQLPDDEFRYALIRGALYRMPPPKARHGRVVSTIDWYLRGFAVEHGLGVTYNQSGFILARDPDVLLEPDLAFVNRDRVPADEDAYPELAPDLVVEVASPSQSGPSIDEKIALYLAAGVRLIWVVDPARRAVHVYRTDGTDHLLSERDVLDGEDVLPGFQVLVDRLFA
jgi:Uma2 family endonuclease